MDGKYSHNSPVPDRKYIKKGQKPVGYVVDEDVDQYVEAWAKPFRFTKSEAVNYMLREFKRVMGPPPPPLDPPKVPEGAAFQMPKRKRPKAK